MIETTIYFVLAGILVMTGLGTIATARNLVKIVMALQVILFGANLALFNAGLTDSGPSLFSSTLVIFSVVLGASVEAVALCIVILVYQRYHTLDVWKVDTLKH